MTTLGAQYLIQGNITSMQELKTDSKGRPIIRGVSYTLKIVDPSTVRSKGT